MSNPYFSRGGMGRGMRGRGGPPAGQSGFGGGGSDWPPGGSSMHHQDVFGGGRSHGPPPIRGRGIARPTSRDRSRSPVTIRPAAPIVEERRYVPPGAVTESPSPAAAAGKPPTKMTNDCEIIVLGKGQQQYAEMIESALKEYGLRVDLMFPKQDIRLGTFIDSIAALGTIFAVVIRPDNESRGSVSVHVLRGPPKPEEHRNMPLTSAYQLIRERFYELKRQEVGIIPDNVKTVLKYLQDDRSLTDNEYKTVITFLQNRRKKQFAFENRNSNLEMDDIDFHDPKSVEDLQTRILAIMNDKSADKGRGTDIVSEIDKNPVVQQALNNLISSEFLSNVIKPTSGSMGSLGRTGPGNTYY